MLSGPGHDEHISFLLMYTARTCDLSSWYGVTCPGRCVLAMTVFAISCVSD